MITLKKQHREYAEYQNSQIERLTRLPENWKENRLKYVAKINPEKLSEDTNANWILNYIDISNVDINGNILGSEEYEFGAAPSRARMKVKNGDTIISTVRTYLKAIGYIQNAQENLIVSTGFAVLRPKKEILPEFLCRLASSQEFVDSVVAHSDGVSYPAISPAVLGVLPVWIPSMKEQQEITSYLDEKCAIIDRAIEGKKKQIKILQEQRSAIINQAVTKGLDEKVEMKESGVEWVNKIPLSWSIQRIKFLVKKIGSGKTPKGGSAIYVDSGVIFLRSQNVHNEGLRLEDVAFIDEKMDQELANTRVQHGDVLLNITGASIGRSSVVPEDFPAANVNQHVCIIRLKNCFLAEFIGYAMQSQAVQDQITTLENGTSREGLNFPQVANLVLAMPPTQEVQMTLVGWIKKQTARIDISLQKIDQSILLLNEYKTSLVSHVVTGKILIS